MDNKDTKITIRINEGEIEEIDNFLRTNSRFASRSEFIRFTALEYISQNRVTILGPNEISLKLDKIMEQTLALAIRQGYFNDRNDAITEILNAARSSGLISKIIDSKNNELRAVMDRSQELQGDDTAHRTSITHNQNKEEIK